MACFTFASSGFCSCCDQPNSQENMAIMILLLRVYRLLCVVLLLSSVVASNENEMEVVGGGLFESMEWKGEEVWDGLGLNR